MDVNTFIQLVNGIGFPIAACIAMAVFIIWDKKNRREDKKEIYDKYEQSFDALRVSIENNTKIVQTLIDNIKDGGIE
jgi:hypothetical protein